jgi:GNAT superfamily N-acetyltransferase
VDIRALAPQLANSRAYWLGWGDTERSDGDLALYRSGIADAQLNGVLRCTDRDLDEALAEARARLDGVPWMWWAGPDSAADLAERLLARGATEVGTMPVMAVDLDRVTDVAGPPGLTVGDAPDLREWVEAYAPSFGMTPDQVDDVLARENGRPDEPGSLVRFEARLDGRIVGTSALLEHAGVAGVYVVTVAVQYRRQGIGAVLTDAALRAGRERGLRVGTLQATRAGRPVYQRMGFEIVTRYRLFTL